MVLGGSFVYLAVGMSLAIYCWSVNRKAEAAEFKGGSGRARQEGKRRAAAQPFTQGGAGGGGASDQPRRPLSENEPATQWHLGPGNHAVGTRGFPGLSLLECGVPANDPNVRKAADFVREHAANLQATYELALAILFLDRLGDRKDKELIQTFALRLIAGQTGTGGWSYTCPILSPKDHTNLLAVLQGCGRNPRATSMPCSARAARRRLRAPGE